MPTPEPSPTSPDRLAELLADYQAALDAADSLGPDGEDTPSAAPAERLKKAADCLRRLEQDRLGRENSWPVHALSDWVLSGNAQLGRFRIQRVLGRGGHGIVYLADDPRLGRQVALKVPRPETLISASLRRRFVGEARAAAGLDHPNLVPIYEAEDAGPFCYLVAGYCPGPTLHAWLKQRAAPVAPREAATLVEILARATHHAHERGVIHRDLKPANILLQPVQSPRSKVQGPKSKVEGQQSEQAVVDGPTDDLGLWTLDLGLFIPKITDFGLAKVADAETQTTGGGMLGTPDYMAPEQAEGRARTAGPECDVYALGAILYEMVTGRPPFKAATAMETILQLLHQEPVPLRLLQQSTPRDLETICLKCLRKEPDKRYATARELADDLGRFLRGEPIMARPVSGRERAIKWVRRRPALTALTTASVAASLALIGLAIWFAAEMGNARGKLDGAEAQAETAQKLAETRDFYALLSGVRERAAQPTAGWTLANIEDLRRAATLTPARERLADLRTEATTALGAIDLRELGVVAKGFTADLAVFDPTGRYLALGQAKTQTQETPECLVLLLDGRGRRVVRRLTFRTARVDNPKAGWVQDGVRALTFSADGRWLVAGSRSGRLHRWDLEHGSDAASSWPAHDAEIHYLAFGADGLGLFSASRRDQQVKRWSCAGLPAEGGLRLTHHWRAPARILGFTAHPREDWVVCATYGGGNHALNAKNLAPLHSPWPACDAELRFLPDGVTMAALGDRGVCVASVLDHQLIRKVHASDRTADDDAALAFASTSRGTLLATGSERTKHLQLWNNVTNGLQLADIFVGGGTLHGDFSPDGRILAVPGDDRTLLYEVTGQREQTFVALQPLPILTCALQPDGHSLGCLARSLWAGNTRDITVWPLGDGKEGFPDDAPIRKDGGWWGPAATESVLATPGENDFSMAFSPNWQLLAHTERGGVMLRGHTSRLRPRRLPNVAGIDAAALCFDPAGKLWGALNYDVRVWDADFKEPFRWSNAAERDRSGLASLYSIVAGRSWAVVGGRDGRLRLFHTSKPRLAWTKRAADSPVRSVALSPDETLAAAASGTGEIHVFRLPGGETATRLPAHRDRVEGLSWSRHGLLASGGHDQTVKLWRWNGSALSELLTLRQPAPVRWLAFHPDGVRLFVLVDGERAVRVWHLDRLWARLGEMGLGEGLPVLEPMPLPPPAPELVPDPLVVDPPHGPNGLRAELFDELGCNYCVKVRHDLPLTFDLGGGGVDSRLPASFCSVRWTGWLKPPRPGGYVLALESSNYVRLWMDGKIALSRGPDTEETCEVEVWLSDHPHALRIEYIKCPYTNRLAIKWQQKGGFPLQPISPLALFHDKATAEKATVPWPGGKPDNAHKK